MLQLLIKDISPISNQELRKLIISATNRLG